MCQDLIAEAGKRNLIGFSDWSNNDRGGFIKKAPVGPVKQLERELKKYCKVIPIDEYKTSKLHKSCHQELKKIYREKRCKDDTRRRVKIHSVLLCPNKICQGIVVNCDNNASCNILQLLKSFLTDGTRPELFRRNHSPTKLSRSTVSSPEIGRPSQDDKGRRTSLHHYCTQITCRNQPRFKIIRLFLRFLLFFLLLALVLSNPSPPQNGHMNLT